MKTPVWIAAAPGGGVVYTNITSGKVKRIRNNNKVRIAPCTARGKVTGSWRDAIAHIAEEEASRKAGIEAITRKYGWQMKLALFLSRLSGRYEERAIIELGF